MKHLTAAAALIGTALLAACVDDYDRDYSGGDSRYEDRRLDRSPFKQSQGGTRYAPVDPATEILSGGHGG